MKTKEQQTKREIKKYLMFNYKGILPFCSEERIEEIINNTYNHIKDKDFCFDNAGHVAGTGRDEILRFLTPEEQDHMGLCF